jgi:hypothetical protein
MSEADTSNQQSLSLTGETNSPNPSGEMVPTTAATQSLSQQGIQGIDPTHNLISRNRNLLQQVGQLEQAIRQYQEELQFQQARSQTQESLLLQHKELLKASEDQVNRLFKELESSHQINQRQQILIETLSNQVETAHERLAQIERDCALTQQRYHEQFHQLQQTETTCEELQVRLERQQQQTLQFKAALEKSLEVSTSSYLHSNVDENEGLDEEGTSELLSDASFLRRSLSEELELLSSDYENMSSDWENLASSGFDFISPPTPSKTEEANIAANSLPEMLPRDSKNPVRDKSQSVDLPNLTKPSLPETPILPLVQDTEISPDSSDLESFSKLWEIADLDLGQEVLEDRFDLDNDNAIAASLDNEEPENRPTTELAESSEPIDNKPIESESLLAGASWPSPLVNPLRPTKRLKSWAAIDLPRFPRFRRSSH